ncbi:hypothetical protein [Haladaptatus sp. T7]|uniref:hypothetical protein n=1 Tax=Haladaptatus sp. T7 TaxID=2029368 RepID=UPI0021A254D6|nr:hypothetical protein [Haladaptatus sp. T7]GKZ14738.1 hypothetical protein HAL_26190 [Haladaptatus sp. T7]
MSNQFASSTTNDDDRRAASDDASVADLTARLELLAEENERLRDEYRRARQTSYRRTALGMAGIGALAGLGGLLFPSSQTVLFALAGTGLFAGVLTYFLTPEQFVSASVGERTYAAHAATGAELVETLGLSGTSVYLPAGNAADENAGVRLFVPQHREYDLPDGDDATTLFVVTDDERKRGVAVPPTGAGLFHEFEGMVGGTADRPRELANQLADALVEGFELVESATPDVDEDGRVTVAITGSRYGEVDRFDHPIASFVAVGLVRGTDRPVTLESAESDDDRSDYLVTCRFDDEE